MKKLFIVVIIIGAIVYFKGIPTGFLSDILASKVNSGVLDFRALIPKIEEFGKNLVLNKFKNGLDQFFSTSTPALSGAEDKVSVFTREKITKGVINPGPLRVVSDQASLLSFALTQGGVIKKTNDERAKNGLVVLSESKLLDTVAESKAADLFARQYFAHVSPSGENVANLADGAGYEYILIGENLALGNFTSDSDLVTAWMNSSGHRANILNAQYKEMGVAVKRGVFEGRNVWIGVQSFGMPLSACAMPEAALKAKIDAEQNLITSLDKNATALKQTIDNFEPKSGTAYNTKVDEYNALVGQINSLVAEVKGLIAAYNAEVKSFNDCATQ